MQLSSAIQSLAVLCLALVLPSTGVFAQEGGAPKGVIIMIGDGFGPNQQALLEDWRTQVEKKKCHLFDFASSEAVMGFLDTSPHGTTVADSAATATAMACGVATQNKRIAVDHTGKPVETVLELAQSRGWVTGLVTTARLTHATPACFAAHILSRDKERQIADQMLTTGVDIMLGGGASFFSRSDTPLGELIESSMYDAAIKTSHTDVFDLIAEAREKHGYKVVGTRASMLAAPPSGRLLGLFSADHLPYVIDREELKADAVPTLAEMTRFSIDRLKRTGKPYLLMVEAGRIDHAAHKNDAAAMLQEALDFDDAIGEALKTLRESPRDVSLLVTSDHETGGFSLGEAKTNVGAGFEKEFEWLGKQKVSFEFIGTRFKVGEDQFGTLESWIGMKLTPAERKMCLEIVRVGTVPHQIFKPHRAINWYSAVAQVIGARTGIIWNTGGHTDAPIPVYAAAPFAQKLKGMNSNCLVGILLRQHVSSIPVAGKKGD